MSRYAKFARVYDQAAHQLVAEEFRRTMQRELGRVPRCELALDLGCGSGLLTQLLPARARTVVGVDLSPEMLAIARERCRRFGKRVSFLCADLTRPLKIENVDLATASGDIVNHILRLEDLELVFRNVRAALSTGGVFVFDSLTEACFECDWDEKVYRMQAQGGDLVMECSWDRKARTGTARMTSYERIRGALFRRSTTVLKEKYHSDRELRRLLARAGFRSVEYRQWSPWPEQLADARMDRALWIARAE